MAKPKTSKSKTKPKAGSATPPPAISVANLRELKKFGIVIHYKGKYHYVHERDWKPNVMSDRTSGVAKALVERGTYVAHTGAIAAPLGGWSTLLNLSAVIKGATGK